MNTQNVPVLGPKSDSKRCEELFRGAWRAGAFLSILTTSHIPIDPADD
jgi:hypothetical protein